MAAEIPSLRRLQSLDSDTASLEDKVLKLEDIIFSNSSDVNLEQKQQSISSRYQGRKSWALRWILRNLQSPQDQQPQNCLSPALWRILTRLVTNVESSTAVRALHSNNVLACLDRTLSEAAQLHKWDDAFVAHIAVSSKSQEEPMKTGDLSSSSLNGNQKRGSKGSHWERPAKRLKDEAGQSSDSKQQIDFPFELFDAISSFLSAIATFSSLKPDSTVYSTSHQLITPFSNAEPAQAARIVGNWLRAMNAFEAWSSCLPPVILFESLHIMLHVWSERSTGKTSIKGDEVIEVCARYCLIPSLGLLRTLTQNHLLEPQTYSTRIAQTVAQFVVSQLLQPAKLSFQRSVTTSPVADENIQNPPENLLKIVLKPISNALDGEVTLVVSSTGFSNLLTQFFLLAIKCARLVSPKSRLEELPWLEAVFVHSTTSAGIDLTPGVVGTRTELEAVLLNGLLEVAQQYNIKLTHGTLHEIVMKYSGIAEADDVRIDWRLLEKVLSIDPQVFLPGITAKSTSEDQLPSNLSRNLLQHMSRQFYMAEDRYVTPHGPSSTGRHWQHGRRCIIMPLLDAYVNARMTKQFLELWKDCLGRFYQSSSGNQISISEDSGLISAVADALIMSLTSNQVVDLLLAKTTELEKDHNDFTNKQIHITWKRADAVLLRTILESITNNSELRMAVTVKDSSVFQRIFQSTTKSLHNIHKEWLAGDRTSLSFAPTQLWQLLAAAHRCWVSVVQIDNESHSSLLDDNTLDEIITILKDSHARMSGGTMQERETSSENSVAAVNMLCNVLNDLYQRHWPRDNLRSAIMTSLKWFNVFETPPSERDISAGLKIIVIMCNSPKVLDDLDLDARKLLILRRHMTEFDSKRSQSRTETSTTSEPTFLALLQQSEKTSPGLLGNSLEALFESGREPRKKERACDNNSEIFKAVEYSLLQIDPIAMSCKEKAKVFGDMIDTIRAREEVVPLDQLSLEMSVLNCLVCPSGHSHNPDMHWESIPNLAKSLEGITLHHSGKYHLLLEVLTTFKDLVTQCLLAEMHASSADQTIALLSILNDFDFDGTFKQKDHGMLCRLLVLSCILGVTTGSDVTITRDNETFTAAEDNICASLCEMKLSRWQDDRSVESNFGRLLPQCLVILDLMLKISGSVLQKRSLKVESLLDICTDLIENAKDINSRDGGAECRDILHIMVMQCRWKYKSIKAPRTPDIVELYDLLYQTDSSRARDYLEVAVAEHFSSMDQQQREKMLQELLEGALTSTAPKRQSRWSLLKVLISVASVGHKTKPTKLLIPPQLETHLMLTLATSMSAKDNSECAVTIASSILQMLQRSSDRKAINQLVVESILSSVAATFASATKHQAQTQQKNMARLYLVVTSILRVLLQQHRHRLRGRFDLLILTLQTLLRPLFSPSSATNNLAERSLFSAKHAEQFARLITLLCEPTVSSTSKASDGAMKRQHLPLTDETINARRYAGQYVPALLLSLCELQLRGKFVADGVREALMPAVYVMFDVMGSEVLSAAFEAGGEGEHGMGMSSGVRTVFRGWWEVWKRERKRRTK